MFGYGEGSIQLGRVFGIRIGASPSWFVILFLAVFWLSGSFRDALGGSSTEGYLVAIAAVALFYISLLLHEFGHAFAARREGIEVVGIDLWLLGGVAKLSRDSKTPGEEFRVAAAGPLVTLLIVGACFGLMALLEGAGRALDIALLESGSAGSTVQLLVGFLASVNAVLFVFNLVPAFPLDGGRIARSIAWKLTGDRTKGTVFAARLGQLFGILMVGYGAYVFLNDDRAFSGIWWALIGWMIFSAAGSAAVGARVEDRLEGVRVEDVMDRSPVTMPASTTLIDAEEQWFARGGWPWFPVVDDNGRFVGIAEREAVTEAVASGRPALPVGDLLDPSVKQSQSVTSDQPLEAAIDSEPLRRLGAVMAVDTDGHLRGVLTIEQVRRALTAAAPGRA